MSELYELPDGWAWKSIDDVCEKITDGAHKSPKTIDDGKPYITVRDVDSKGSIDFINCKKISQIDYDLLVKGNCKPLKGDVLFSKDGTVGKVALINYNKDFVVLSSLAILRPSVEIESEYLAKYIQSPFFYDKAIKSKTGAAIKRVVLRTIKNLDIPLPPLQEQKRIVSKLDRLFEKIDKAIALHQKNMDESNVFIGSVLNEVFGELKGKYEKRQLKEFAKITSSKRIHKADYIENGIPFFRSKEIILKSKMMDLTDILYISEETFLNFEKKFGVPKEGDILITAVGTIGITYLVNKNDKFYFKDGNLIWLKDIDNELDKKYLLYSFKSPQFRDYVDEISKGAAQKALTIIKLNELTITLPPLVVQQKTVKYLDQISEKTEKVKQVQKEKMESLKALKASLLDRAFRGEL